MQLQFCNLVLVVTYFQLLMIMVNRFLDLGNALKEYPIAKKTLAPNSVFKKKN